jgi:hypothetical protein
LERILALIWKYGYEGRASGCWFSLAWTQAAQRSLQPFHSLRRNEEIIVVTINDLPARTTFQADAKFPAEAIRRQSK